MKADADLRRISGLIEKGMASQADLDAAQSAAELYAGQLDQAAAEEKQARENLSKTTIRSPMSGTVSQLNKEQGEMTLGSQFQADVILVVADLSKMQVRAQVDENDIVGVKVGDSSSVEIDAFPDTTFRGIVAEISQSASTKSLTWDQQGKNFDVKVAIIDTVKGIRPGMLSTVDIATDKRDSVLSVSLQCVAVRDRVKARPSNSRKKSSPNRPANSPRKRGREPPTRRTLNLAPVSKKACSCWRKIPWFGIPCARVCPRIVKSKSSRAFSPVIASSTARTVCSPAS